MSLDELKARLLSDPLVKAYYDKHLPKFDEKRKIIKQNKLIKAKFLRILMSMYLINTK